MEAGIMAAIDAGYPVIVGMPWGVSATDAPGGVVPWPYPEGERTVGHAVLVVGVNQADPARFYRIFTLGYWWGDHGFGYLHRDMGKSPRIGLRPPLNQAWVVRDANIPPADVTDAERNAMTKAALVVAVNAITEPPTTAQRDAIIALAGQLIIPAATEIIIDNLQAGQAGASAQWPSRAVG
jgi:hypothetical protein